MRVDSKPHVILGIVQLILAKVIYVKKTPWFDEMFQLIQKLFGILQAAAPSCGDEKCPLLLLQERWRRSPL